MTDAAEIGSGQASGPGREELRALVDAIAAKRRGIAALQAEEARLLADAHAYAASQLDPAPSPKSTLPRDIPFRSLAATIGAAVRASDRTINARMAEAVILVEDFPLTHAAFATGHIERGHVLAILEAGCTLPSPEARAEYEERVLRVAVSETAGRLRPAARTIADRIHPVPLDQRHATAKKKCGVWATDLEDGLGELRWVGPAHLTRAAVDRATQLAHSVIQSRTTPDAGAPVWEPDTRTLDMVRADLIADLLLTGHATGEASAASIPRTDAIRARVQITVPVLSLLGTPDADRNDLEPADLAGHGPVPLHIARELAAAAPGWDRILTHPITGSALACDRYQPTESLKRFLAVRDEHCRFPGCRQPIGRCDLDHTIPASEGGETSIGNLAALCRRHHVLKHNSAWRVRQLGGGILEWTSPDGRLHDDVPPRTLVFAAERSEPSGAPPGDPPPF